MLQPFEMLSYNDQLERLTEAARVALRSYGYQDSDLHAVAYINNAVFEVHTPDKGHFALRLHRPGHKRLEWIKSELVWLAALCRDTLLCVPQPIQSGDAEPLVYASVDGLSEPIVGLALMVITRVALPVYMQGFAPLLALMVTLVVPAVVGVPEITPVPVLTLRPGGSGLALKLVGLLVAVIV